MTRAGRNHRAISALAASIVAVALFASALVPSALAIGADKAEVVLVLDFSASILDDATTRNQFGAALERIADRVDETARDLIAGDTTISIVQFGTKAADVPKCDKIETLGSPSAVQKLSRVPADRRCRVQEGPRRGADQVDRARHELRRGDGGRPPTICRRTRPGRR